MPVTGTLAYGGHDLWAFDAKAGQTVSLRMQADDSNLNSHLTVYGPHEVDDPREIVHAENRYVRSPSGEKLDAGIEGLVLPVDGQHLIVAGADENTSGKYRLGMETLSEGEARPYVGAALAAQARSLAEAGDMENAIDRVEAAQAIAQELDSLSLYFTLCQMQIYEELRDAVARSCVNLTALAPVIKPGMVGSGMLDSPFSDPWLWDIQSGSVVSIALSALMESDSNLELDPYLTLYDPHLQVIAENDDIDNLNQRTNSLLDDIELAAPGVYWITAGRCCPYDDQGSTGNYTLEVEIQRELE